MELISTLATRLRYWLPAGSPTMDSPVVRRTGLFADNVFVFEGLATVVLGALQRHAATQDRMGDRPPLWLVKYELAKAIQDCQESSRQALTVTIYQASEAAELWDLLPAIRSCVAQTHGDKVACQRTEGLLSFFGPRGFGAGLSKCSAAPTA